MKLTLKLLGPLTTRFRAFRTCPIQTGLAVKDLREKLSSGHYPANKKIIASFITDSALPTPFSNTLSFTTLSFHHPLFHVSQDLLIG